jgi:hypothetical protein
MVDASLGNPSRGALLCSTNCAMCHNFAGKGGALTRGKYALRYDPYASASTDTETQTETEPTPTPEPKQQPRPSRSRTADPHACLSCSRSTRRWACSRARPSARRRGGCRRGSARPRRARAGLEPSSTCLPSPVRRWTDSRYARPRRRASSRWRSGGSRDAPPGKLPAGSAAGIATGGTVPEGADAVVPVELADDRGDMVAVAEAAASGQHVRPRGGDARGRRSSRVGRSGRSRPDRRARGRRRGRRRLLGSSSVAILATGSELRSPGEASSPGRYTSPTGG